MTVGYWVIIQRINPQRRKFKSAHGIRENDIGLYDISKEKILEVYKGTMQQVYNLAGLRDMGMVSLEWKKMQEQIILDKMERIK